MKTTQKLASNLDFASEHLQSRMEDPGFVLVEIGHGEYPVSLYGTDFSGQRRYFGYEANLRNTPKKPTVPAGQNWTFLDVDTGSRMISEDDYFVLSPEYETSIDLPDENADEIFLGNVLTDPLLRQSDHFLKIIAEVQRLIAKTGVIVCRETYTPIRRWNLDRILGDFGLRSEVIIEASEDPEAFTSLEKVYADEVANTGYYEFIKPA